MHNNVLSPFTMLFEATRTRKGLVLSESDLRIPLELLPEKSEKSEAHAQLSAKANSPNRAITSLEMHLRRMLSRCALRVNIPYSSNPDWPKSSEVRSSLAPTTKKLIRFVDRSDHYWEAVVAYLKPVSISLGEDYRLSNLAWDLYLLILAAKYKSEVVLPPERTLALIHNIESSTELNAEAKARLSAIEGLFRFFTVPVEGPCLRFLPNISSLAVSERIDEIMEDAYLLEASHLRRLFGIKQNIASIKRDLRLLLSFIRKERPWAKGLVTTSSNFIVGGNASLAALEKLIELVPALEKEAHYPVLAIKDENIVVKRESCFQFVKGISSNLLISMDVVGLQKRKPNKSFDRSAS
jgi:hypothetical protein